jgi:hypothetical protein
LGLHLDVIDSVVAPFLTKNFGYCLAIEHGTIRGAVLVVLPGR